jgi:SPW repeat
MAMQQPLHRESATTRPAAGNGAASQAMSGPWRAAAAAPGVAAQLFLAAGLLAGLWVAISPWFLTLQTHGGNATASDLITGLAVAALAVFAAAGGRGMISLQAAGALAGAWLIISPFILAVSFPVTTAMYWSNIWAGAVITLAAVAALAAAQPHTAR